MSNIFSSRSSLALVLCAAIAVSGCGDVTAPASSPGSFVPASSVAASQQTSSGSDLIPDQYIVVFHDGENDVHGKARRLMARTKGKLRHTYSKGLRGFAASMTAREASELAADPSVAYVEQDEFLTLGVGKPGGSTNPRNGKGKTTTPTPIEPGVITQTNPPSWGLDRIDQMTIPLSNTYSYSATGAGVNVYIMDSGIRITHAEFGNRASAAFSLFDDGNDVSGCHWHGTHVAGIVGGLSSGAAKGALLHSVRILDCNGVGSVSGAVAGIDWIIANGAKPAVINLSVGATSSTTFTEAVDRATASGIVVVAAAGNQSVDACTVSPANAANAITVGATNSGDQQAFFSNFGPCVDIMAPGDAIASASSADDASLRYGSGTSMAAPFVAAAAALYLEKNPTASPSITTSAILQSGTVGLLGSLSASTPNLLLRTR